MTSHLEVYINRQTQDKWYFQSSFHANRPFIYYLTKSPRTPMVDDEYMCVSYNELDNNFINITDQLTDLEKTLLSIGEQV